VGRKNKEEERARAKALLHLKRTIQLKSL